MSRLSYTILCLFIAVCSARMAYEFPADAELILQAPLQNSFTCEGRIYGYYADDTNNCQVFHVCLPIEDDTGEVVNTAHFSFVCGNGTVFSQDSLTCSHPEEAFPCDQASTLYDTVNSLFGVIPDEQF